jgi:hypothetical protein
LLKQSRSKLKYVTLDTLSKHQTRRRASFE